MDYEKFCNSFLKTWKKSFKNVSAEKTYATIEKKLKKYLKIFKNLEGNFKEIGNNLSNKFFTHFGRNFV